MNASRITKDLETLNSLIASAAAKALEEAVHLNARLG